MSYRRSLRFVDALRLLGVADDPTVERLGRMAGVGASAVTVASFGTVDFFALRDETVRWGNTMVQGLRERLHGLNRYDRTQRLAAAHAVIVVTAFFEAFDAVLPDVDQRLAPRERAEQVAAFTGGRQASGYSLMLGELVNASIPVPAADLTTEEIRDFLTTIYHEVLVDMLAVKRPKDVASEVVRQAVERYADAYRRLAVQAPEFGVWARMVDAQATRTLIRTSTARLTEQLAELRAGVSGAGHEAVDAVLAGLGHSYRARLRQSILSSGDTPSHLTLPTLGQGYVVPRGLVAVAGARALPATESWWERGSPVSDVQALLLGHLTTSAATDGPLVVLGQPGSGKSVLTRVLAAGLPESDFLVVRVELRTVHADASPQAQLESAIYQLLGERVTWPELVRRSGSALPVVIMDGFDELLQATGVNRADYLEQLREFQEREANLGRPVAVLVTSRTVVADRARFPEDTVVVRLQPFDAGQVGEWLGVWNGLNEAGLRARSLRPLPPEVALAHGELAEQPLLLLLLALYDAGANELQTDGGGIGRVELYERLFQDFVRREVDKHHHGAGAEQRELEMDREWRRLSAVALAMLNRGGDVITEAELDADVPHLLHREDLGPARSDSMSRALSAGQLLVGRFFFIHESQAARDTGAVERTFEFLHATFGDFLAARQIVAALADAADERELRRRRPQSKLDAGFLYAATSFVTVARRAPLFEFCRGMLARLDPDTRRRCREVAVHLLPDAGYPHPTWSLADYEPRRNPVAARHAAFSANLVCFAVMLADRPVDVAELAGEPVVGNWRTLALLWRSQLDRTDRHQLWQSFRVAWRLDADPPWLEIRVEDGADIGLYESLPWPTDDRPAFAFSDIVPGAEDVRVSAEDPVGRAFRLSAFHQTAVDARKHLYALSPFWRQFGAVTTTEVDAPFVSDAGMLLELLLTPPGTRPAAERERLFELAAKLFAPPDYTRLVLRQLVEEADLLGARALVTIIDGFGSVAMLRNLDLVAKLIATVAPLALRDLSLMESMTWTLSYVVERHPHHGAAFAEQIRLAFAGVGRPVPDWADLSG